MTTPTEPPLRRPHQPIAAWAPGDQPPEFDPIGIAQVARQIREPVHLVTRRASSGVGVALGGDALITADGYRLLGTLPPLYPEWLGGPCLCVVRWGRVSHVGRAIGAS